jgi:membrane protease YdiL (CAAX protease family)
MLMETALTATKNQDSGSTWGIPTAAIIGIGYLLLYMTSLFFVTNEIRSHRSRLRFRTCQLSMASSLISVTGTAVLLAPVVAAIARRRRLGEWWQSVQWNGDRSFLKPILLGAVFAVLFQLTMTAIHGNAGYFRDDPLVVSVGLYVVTSVFLEPALEEIYFRGILFLALAKRFGEEISIVIVTLIFAFLHPGHRLNVLPIAILLGAIRLRTRSVASCFALHASYNLFLMLYQLVLSR